MKVALIADLHGNMPATLAVADDIRKRGADAIYCLGDVVGKGPDSLETMDWALEHCSLVLAGNWDLFIGDLPWYRDQLGEARLHKLKSLPLEHWFTFSGRRVRLLHGRNLVPDCVYPDSPMEEQLQFFDTQGRPQPDVVGFADVHQPFFIRLSNAGVLFNTGSVGNPLFGQTDASYVMLEGNLGDARGPLVHSIISVEYDRDEAIRRTLSRHGLPMADAFITELRTGRYSR